MNSSFTTRELTQRYIVPTYNRFDLEIVRGAGCRIWTETDQELLDFGAGIAVCSLGHADRRVTEAVFRQCSQLVHTSNLYYTRPAADLAQELVGIVGVPGKVFFCNSGAEANEGLFKLARKFGNGSRFEIITFQGSFHGRTLGGISATGQDKVKQGFGPLVPGFTHVPYGDLEAVRAAIRAETVAILLEPVQGESGIHIAKGEFLQGLRTLCNEHNLLLLFDEVQCGLGRTGDWCGWQSIAGKSVVPDGVSWAKGIANGFPLGAFWIRAEPVRDRSELLCDLLGPGTHGTTYGGNLVACAAALAVLRVIQEEGLLKNALEIGAYFREELREVLPQSIAEVRALGLMIGVEFHPDAISSLLETNSQRSPALQLTTKLISEGLLAIPAGDRVLRFLPPLNVTRCEVDEAVEKFSRVFELLKKN